MGLFSKKTPASRDVSLQELKNILLTFHQLGVKEFEGPIGGNHVRFVLDVNVGLRLVKKPPVVEEAEEGSA
jgi:hypothetical protein